MKINALSVAVLAASLTLVDAGTFKCTGSVIGFDDPPFTSSFFDGNIEVSEDAECTLTGLFTITGDINVKEGASLTLTGTNPSSGFGFGCSTIEGDIKGDRANNIILRSEAPLLCMVTVLEEVAIQKSTGTVEITSLNVGKKIEVIEGVNMDSLVVSDNKITKLPGGDLVIKKNVIDGEVARIRNNAGIDKIVVQDNTFNGAKDIEEWTVTTEDNFFTEGNFMCQTV